MTADTTVADSAHGADDAQPQGGNAQAQGADAPVAHGVGADQGASGDSDIAAKLKAYERDNAKYRRRIAELEATEQERQTANLTELQKAEQLIAELKAAASESQVRERDRSLRLAAVEAATKLGFRSPDIAYRLLDQSEVEWSDDGTPKHVERLLRAVLEREPYLAKTNLPDLGGGPRGSSPSTQPSMNDLLRASARGS